MILFLSLSAPTVWGQNGGERTPFDITGVGARPLAMGGAYVATDSDPLLIFWNPAGLDYVDKKQAVLFYSNLLESQYGFIGYAHPTLHFGTFGLGILYLGTGDIKEIAADNMLVRGTFSYSDNLWLFSYAKQTPWWFSVGGSIRILRQSIKNTDTAIGADVGLTFKPQLDNIFLNNLALGLSFQNLVPARIRINDQIDNSPRTLRVGLSKVVPLGRLGERLTINMDIDNAFPYGMRSHFGAEYVYKDYAMLRFGLNDHGKPGTGDFQSSRYLLTFGVGTFYQNFKLDYSFGQMDPWLEGAQHRISVTFEFGKDREQLKKEEDERRLKEIEAEVRFRNDLKRKEDISSGLESGRQFLIAGDLPRAYRELFKITTQYGDQEYDPQVNEAKKLLDDVNAKIKDQQDQELRVRTERNAAELARQERDQKISEYFEKGKSFFETDDFVEAIEEWNKALELDSLNQQVVEFREKAVLLLKEKIAVLITKAGKLARNNLVLDALNVYNEVLQLSRPLSQEYRTAAEGYMRSLERRLKLDEIVGRAAAFKSNRDYARAAELFKEAMQIDPGNDALVRRYRDNEARANAVKMEMTPEVLVFYNEGYRLFSAKEFEKALEKFEQARALQPLNKELIGAIDLTKRELEKKKNRSGEN